MSDGLEIKVIGGDIPTLERFSTGLWGLDRALGFNGEHGGPLRSLYEVYGHPGVGKSSLCYYLSAKVKEDGGVTLADIEGTMDGQYVVSCAIQAGFHGSIIFVGFDDKKRKDKIKTHEKMMQEAVDALKDDNISASVIDSVGMVQPIMEREGDIEEAFVGRRALAVTKMVRRAIVHLRTVDDPKALFVVNHVNPIIGGRGHSTPGGAALKYGASVRLHIHPVTREEKEKELGVLISEVSVEKLRYGGANKSRKAIFATLPGIGVSPHVTAMYDCFTLGLAKRESYVKVLDRGEWKSVARIGDLLESALDGDFSRLSVFSELLQEREDPPGGSS